MVYGFHVSKLSILKFEMYFIKDFLYQGSFYNILITIIVVNLL